AIFERTLHRFPLFGIAHRITSADIALDADVTIPAGSVLCFSYPEFHRARGIAPVSVKAVVRELLAGHTFATRAAHTPALPNRGPCLMTRRDGPPSRWRPWVLGYVRLRDRWEDVWRSLVQLVLGTYMVWDARRLRLCATYFDRQPPTHHV